MTTTQRPTDPTISLNAGALATALAPAAWGLTYVVTTELLPPGRPLLAGVLRAVPAGLLLVAVTRRRPSGIWWFRSLVLGTLNVGAFFALLFVAAYRLPGGVAATLGGIQPLIATALAAVLLAEGARVSTYVPGVLGCAGVALMVLRAEVRLDAIGVAAGLGAALCGACGLVLTKRWGRPAPLLAVTAWQLLAGGLVLLPVALAVEGVPPSFTADNLIGYTWLATGGGAMAYVLWFRGIASLPVAKVSLLGFMSPVVATLAGWAVLHQSLTMQQAAGMAMVLTAVVAGQRPATVLSDSRFVPEVSALADLPKVSSTAESGSVPCGAESGDGGAWPGDCRRGGSSTAMA